MGIFTNFIDGYNDWVKRNLVDRADKFILGHGAEQEWIDRYVNKPVDDAELLSPARAVELARDYHLNAANTGVGRDGVTPAGWQQHPEDDGLYHDRVLFTGGLRKGFRNPRNPAGKPVKLTYENVLRTYRHGDLKRKRDALKDSLAEFRNIYGTDK